MSQNTRCASKRSFLAERVLSFVNGQGMFVSGETLLVGVSGGRDSLCMLYVLMEIKDELGIHIHIAHLDHMLRGAESASDAKYVSELASYLRVPITVGQRDVKKYQLEHQLSLEEAARELRYQFFLDTANSVGASRVAVGHNADDQVETILMHLIRGTGTSGLCGMRPITFWRHFNDEKWLVVRPLLEVARKEVEAYCQEYHLLAREDSSNESMAFLRNRVRQELLPLLHTYNPNIKQSLLNTAQTVTDDYSFMQTGLLEMFGNVVSSRDGMMVLDTNKASRLHPAMQRLVIREALRQLLGDLRDMERRHVESIRKAFHFSPGKQISLPRGLILWTEYGECSIGGDSKAHKILPSLEKGHVIIVPGETAVCGWRVIADVLGSEGKESLQDKNPFVANFDFDVAGNKLQVINRKPGDRFQPLGMSCSKKLQDFMVDVRIPRAQRSQVPLVCSTTQIIWVVGWRIDERAKVTDQTQRILRLTFAQPN